jgi:hypothetical protein
MALPGQQHTFALENCRSTLDKLRREIERLRDADGPARNDHAFNAAVTAWQLCDWVFANMTPAQKDKLKIHNRFDMQEHARHDSRALHLCRQVATASKHMRVSKFPDPKVKTITTMNAVPAPQEQLPVHVAPGWFLYFDDDGDVQEAGDVLPTHTIFGRNSFTAMKLRRMKRPSRSAQDNALRMHRACAPCVRTWRVLAPHIQHKGIKHLSRNAANVRYRG